MRGFTKRFAAVAMVAGLALGAAACESEGGGTADPAQEAPADDLGGTEGTDLGGTEPATPTETATP